MRFRKLRIAWSMAWGIACVLVVILWVRTQYAIDSFCGPLPGSAWFGVMSRHGGVGLLISQKGIQHWHIETRPIEDVPLPYQTALGFVQYLASPGTFRIRVPYWSLFLLSTILAAAPWIRQLRWRFSLRTLLIATTLVAVGLGLIVWLR
jgi:hypothetical protein